MDLDDAEDEAMMAEFMSSINDAARNGEVERIVGAFKLNPFDQLGVELTAKDAEIKKTYRQKSLLVHPDKCNHPEARRAFDLLIAARDECMDAGKRNLVVKMREDALLELMHQRNYTSVEDYEEEMRADEFQQALKSHTNKLIADMEWRKRCMLQKETADKERLEKLEEKELNERKRKNIAKQNWDGAIDDRTAGWRSFQAKTVNKKTNKRLKS